MERNQQKQIVEALVLASPEPLSAARIAEIAPHLTPAGARQLIEELNASYAEANRAFEIWEVAGGYQLRTRPELAGYVKQLHRERPLRLSRAALETLAVVAYKQPVTRAEIEQVRGVDVGAVLRSLLERKLVRIAGHREVPGRPILYATAKRFLEVFGLVSLSDLPTLRDVEEVLLAEGGEASREPARAPAAADSPDRVAGVEGASESPGSAVEEPTGRGGPVASGELH